MQWIAPSEKDTPTDALKGRQWDAADQLRANSGLNAAQYPPRFWGSSSSNLPISASPKSELAWRYLQRVRGHRADHVSSICAPPPFNTAPSGGSSNLS